jgi:glycosyltransferase involved in cell wall biosynthesis
MISVVIPTLNAAATLPRCLNSLIDAAMSGLVREVIVVDGGSTDDTLALADSAGARIVRGNPCRGVRLAMGAATARGDWLLFLHANTFVEPGWANEAALFIERAEPERPRAGAFRFALDDFEPAARRREARVNLRCRLLGLPYGDQGLLIPARLYLKLGGYRPLPAMEDVDFVRRLGGQRLIMLRARAITVAPQNRRNTPALERLHHLGLLLLHALRVPAPLMSRLYG